MNCERAEELFSEKIEGQLEYTLEATLDMHLEACPRCTNELTELKQAFSLLDTLPEIEPQRDIAAGVRRSLYEQRTAQESSPWRRLLQTLKPARPVAWAAGLAAVALLAVANPGSRGTVIAPILTLFTTERAQPVAAPSKTLDISVRTASTGDCQLQLRNISQNPSIDAKVYLVTNGSRKLIQTTSVMTGEPLVLSIAPEGSSQMEAIVEWTDDTGQNTRQIKLPAAK